jgi:hypothetical protein
MALSTAVRNAHAVMRRRRLSNGAMSAGIKCPSKLHESIRNEVMLSLDQLLPVKNTSKKLPNRSPVLKWIPYSKAGKLSKEAPRFYESVRYCEVQRLAVQPEENNRND